MRLRAGSPLWRYPRQKEQLLREALAGQLETLGEGNRETISTMRSLGGFLFDRGQEDEGLELLSRAVELCVGPFGAEHPYTFAARSSLASALYRAGRLDEAREHATKAVTDARSVAGRPEAPPFDLYAYARLLLTIEPPEMRDPDAALPVAKQAVEMSDLDTLAERHAGHDPFGRTAYLLDTLALAYEMTGDIENAADVQVERLNLLMAQEAGAWELALSAWRIVKYPALSSDAYGLALGAADRANMLEPDTGSYVTTLGAAQYRAGRYDDALATLTRSDDLNDGVSPRDAAFLAMAHQKLDHAREAAAAMARLRGLMRGPRQASNPGDRMIWEEARALLPDVMEALTLNVPGEHPTLQEAIDAAIDGAEIVVADGTYTGPGNRDIDPAGKRITVRSAHGPDGCIIDCQGAGRGFIFRNGERAGTVLEGLTIRNGAAEGDGGAVSCESSSPTIRNCTLIQNTATGSETATGLGGAIYLSASAATIEGCRFVENSTVGGKQSSGGGGIACIEGSEPTIRRCTFTRNAAKAGEVRVTGLGGGIHSSLSNPKISNCTFDRNRATGGASRTTGIGGAIQIFYGRATISGCTFTANEAIAGASTETGVGGAIHLGAGVQTIVGCAFTANRAVGGQHELTGLGGGLHVTASVGTTVTDCTFTGNAASGGTVGASGSGGAVSCSEPRNDLRLTNCMISGNTATGNGGGMWNGGRTGGPRPSIVNCTFSGNRADGGGGGIFNSGNATRNAAVVVVNCIVWGNSPDEITDGSSAATTVSYSNVGGGWPGKGNLNTDPAFADPVNGDLRLAAGSTCIDAGDNRALSESTDLDGNPRFVDDASALNTGQGDPPIVDMGAYEYQGSRR
jgi:tetratricopeptide (TPR) repeat protein